jgi:anti-sigma factor RsiW
MAETHPDELELLAYTEGELDAASARRVADHARSCASCAGRVRALETARGALREAPLLPLPAERRARVIRELPPPPRRAPARARLLALAAALVALAGLVAVVATREGGPTVGGDARQAAEQAPPPARESDRSGDANAPEAAAGRAAPLAQVDARPSRVAAFLRERGYDARVVGGSVEVRTKRGAAVRRLLAGRFPRGGVAVYVR